MMIESVGNVIKQAFKGPQGLVLNVFLAFALQSMWKMLGTIQYIVHLPLLKVGFPSNTSFAFSFIVDLANLKLFNVDIIIESLFGIKQKATQESYGYSNNIL